MSQQVNLHNHGEGSFLDGYARNQETVDQAVALGHQFVTLTDHGECNQHLKMAAAAKKAGLGFIPGIEGYWLFPEQVAWHKEQKDRKAKYPRPSHICLLATTDKGLRNLWALSSEAYTEKYHYNKPIATPDLLRQYSEGIYASDGCMMTRFGEAIQGDRDDEARQILGTLLGIFKERFYMELHTWQYMEVNTDEQRRLNDAMRKINHAKVRFATELGVPLVVVNDSHHARPDQWLNRELTWAFNTSNDNNDKLQASLAEMAQKADHLMGEDELYYWMRRHGIADDVVAEAIKNSYDIASACKIEITPTMTMPRLGASEREDLISLIRACEEGFTKFVIDEGLDQERYMKRLEEELSLIAEKHFAGYFNIVRDSAMAFRSGSWSQRVKAGAPRQPLLLGPGRGSAGGCLVAYLTGITLIDPLKYGTLFSRFLSPGRKGLPDIDVDVPQSERPLVLEYLRKRYGEENVCAIGTLSKNGPKAALRDLGRAMKIPLDDINVMSDHIADVERLKDPNNPDEEELTWADLIERKSAQLRPYRQRFPGLFDKLEEMVGVIRQSGVHASGVLISAEPLLGRVPMRHSKTKGMTTQLDMHDVETLGGVKFDWLGLRHLDTISQARQLIYERHGVWIDFDRTGLSVPKGCTNVLKFGDEHFSDPAIWPAIGEGRTLGIFQVETPNCTSAAIEFKPQSHLDIADLTSVIRPGVSDAGLKEVYLRRRAGKEPVLYDHPMMEKIVGPGWVTNTYGVLVYQEQIMDCVGELAGFNADERDDVRKAVGKKYMDQLQALKGKFIKGCQDNYDYALACGDPVNQTLNEEREVQIAEKIWANIEAAGRYAFNWSHAVEYGAFISTWEIWLKHYYPQEFLVALLATDAKNTNLYLREARRRGITILPPDVNRSKTKFTIEGDAIRYGIDSVRGIAAVTARHLAKGRPYASFEDYLARAGKAAEKTAVYNLICIGAFDTMGTRDEMLDKLERYRATEDLAISTRNNPELLETVLTRRLTNNPDQYRVKRPDFSNPEVVYEIEKRLVGTFVTVDPMQRYLSTLEPVVLPEPLDMLRYRKGEQFIIGGQLTAVNTTVTKKGRTPGAEMAHATISWNEADFRMTIWPEQWRNTKDLFKVGAPVCATVKKLDNGCCLEHLERLDRLFDREGIA